MRSTYVHDTGYTFRFVACGGRWWTHFHWDRRGLHGWCCGSELKKHFPICYHADERLGWLARIDTQCWAGPDVSETVFFLGCNMPDYLLLWCCIEEIISLSTLSPSSQRVVHPPSLPAHYLRPPLPSRQPRPLCHRKLLQSLQESCVVFPCQYRQQRSFISSIIFVHSTISNPIILVG